MSINADLLNEIVLFIVDYYGNYNFPINERTKLESDLGITGDEAWEFFCRYGEKFNVDTSNFLLYDYFDGEGSDILSPLWEFLRLKKKMAKKTFTIGDLIKGIQAGKLDEDILKK